MVPAASPFHLLRPATTLRDARRTLLPQDLRSEDELHAFYREIRPSVRGSWVGPIMRKGLDRNHFDPLYKAFLMGRSGVGKSTELSKLLLGLKGQYVPIRISAMTDIDARNFKPFDVLLIAVTFMLEECERLGIHPAPDVVAPVLRWYADVKTTTSQAMDANLTAVIGAGVPDQSWWHKVLGVIASIKSELRFTAARNMVVVDYSLTRIDTLISALNQLLLDCRKLLWQAHSKEWLIIGEEFDKRQVNRASARAFFVTYGSTLVRLEANLIFNLPTSIYYSPSGSQLPSFSSVIIRDTPVYTAEKEINDDAMQDLKSILWARVSPNLIAPGEDDRLILASGGLIRDLFSLVTYAALVADGDRIEAKDTKIAIQESRQTFKLRLGEQEPLEDETPISNRDKIDTLLRVYRGDLSSNIPDRVLNELISSDHVLAHNGDGWFGLHPLSVDVLKNVGELPPEAPGGVS